MICVLLNDAQWERIAPLLPGKDGDPGRSGEDNRRFIEAVLWIVRAGAPWRDLPEAFGKWYSVWKRFRRWALKGVFARIFAALSEDPDFEYALNNVVLAAAFSYRRPVTLGAADYALWRPRKLRVFSLKSLTVS